LNPFYANVHRLRYDQVQNDQLISSVDHPEGMNIGLIPIVPTFSYTLKF
jgi:hypothetical protein